MTSVEYNRDMNKDINLAIKNKDVNKLNKRMNALDAYMNIGDGPLVGVGAKELVETAQDRNAPEDMLESVNSYEKKQTEMKRKLQEKMFNKN